MSITELQRLTTQYDAAEDRIRLSGSTPLNETLTLWLTQRLLNRLVPKLCQGLEAPGQKNPQKNSLAQPLRSHVEQSFAQQRARAALARQKPVIPAADAPQWRVEAIDLRQAAGGVRVRLRGVLDSEQATLNLPTPALRQWLGIVFEQYRRAGWATQVWPAWMEEANAPPAQTSAVALH